MAQQADCDVIVIGTGHTATNQRSEVSLRRRANDTGTSRRWRHGEHPEAIRCEPGQEPPRAGRTTSANRP
jgi:hypothetical protein